MRGLNSSLASGRGQAQPAKRGRRVRAAPGCGCRLPRSSGGDAAPGAAPTGPPDRGPRAAGRRRRDGPGRRRPPPRPRRRPGACRRASPPDDGTAGRSPVGRAACVARGRARGAGADAPRAAAGSLPIALARAALILRRFGRKPSGSASAGSSGGSASRCRADTAARHRRTKLIAMPAGAGARGAADAVDILLGHVGQLEVDRRG